MVIVTPPPKLLIIAAAVVAFFLIAFKLSSATESYSSYVPNFTAQKNPSVDSDSDSDSDVRNHTLGFEKILALNLPARSDKRDGMSLAASLTNISIEYIDGVRGEDIDPKAYPYGTAAPTFTKPMLGSWRAHLNAIRSVVENGWSSALIMEDDVDWDIRVKEQLSQFAAGSKAIQGYDANSKTHSPYGDDWDLLWIGHCHGKFDESEGVTYAFHDPSTVPNSKLKVNPEMVDWLKGNWPEHTRLVHDGRGFICTYAYAISHRGAEKLLWDLSVKHLTALFDNALDLFCRHHSFDSKCIGAYPSYFWPHQARGGQGKNSDNNPKVGGIEKSITQNIQWPVRMNIDKLIMGKTDFVDSWPEEPEEAEGKDEAQRRTKRQDNKARNHSQR